jgi:glycyl-tRNA synthetase beta chain
MKGRSVLLEIGVEEIPARFLPGASANLSDAFSKALGKSYIDYDVNGIKVYATPRRLAAVIEGVAEMQLDRQHEAFGPSVKAAFDKDGKPTKAAEGFARSHGVSPEELQVKKKGKGEYVVAQVREKGLSSSEVLPGVLKDIVLSLHFPKSMRWGDGDLRFARPIHWFVALFGNEIVKFELDGITSGNISRGHRFLAPEEFKVSTPEDYESLLEKRFVIVAPGKRTESIEAQAKELSSTVGGLPWRQHEYQFRDVANLVEYPTAVLAGFPEKYLELPDELLSEVMWGHQKYISIVDKDDGTTLKNYFIVVSNTRAENAGTVRVGAERVIKARFDDARFYFNEDRKTTLANRLEELKRVTYQDKLGTLYDKAVRLREIAIELAGRLCPEKKELCLRAAELSKTDLVTGVVREFPELQGVMGKYYALNDGEYGEVAQALEEQYLPAFSGDDIPKGEVGAVLSLADRIDTVAAFFSIRLRPTGSEDPFALRRHALAAIAILLGKGYNISISGLLSCAIAESVENRVSPDRIDLRITVPESVEREVLGFFEQRLEQLLLGKGHAHDLVQSVLALSTVLPLADLMRRTEALGAFKSHPEYNGFLTAIKRVRNITPDGELPEVRDELLKAGEERALKEALDKVRAGVVGSLKEHKFAEAIEGFTALTGPVNCFFDHVLVMEKDEELRNNRLALLRDIWALASSVADFSRLLEVAEATVD